MKLIKIVTELAAIAIYLSGIAALVIYINRKYRRIPILMYHSIEDSGQGKFKTCSELAGMSVYREVFEKHLAYLAKKHRVISLKDFIAYLDCKKDIPANAVVLTFDDGFKNNRNVALPLLEKFEFTATFFLIGNAVDGLSGIWLHFLYEILDELSGCGVVWNFNGRLIYKTRRLTNLEKKKFAMLIISHMGNMSTEKSVAVLKDICTQNNLNYQAINRRKIFMKNTDIKELVDRKHTLGAHSMSHVRLSKVPSNLKKKEIEESLAHISKLGNDDFRPFSYPYGTHDSYDKETIALLKKAGTSCAVTTIEGVNNFKSDRYELKRIEIGNFGIMRFTAHFSGVLGDIKKLIKKIFKRK